MKVRYNTLGEDDPIFLPGTEKQFDALIRNLIKRYKLPDKDHATAVVANRIMHIPPDQATSTLKYLGHSVLKHIAYQVAQAKGSGVAHRHQIRELEAALKANMNDAQARDALQKAANDGSVLAKEAIQRLEASLPASNISSIHQMKTVSQAGPDGLSVIPPEPA